jgi:hypothetical protein
VEEQKPKRLILTCKHCGAETEFNQPYAYHAGFGDVGFLYNEAGNATLVWSAYDPYFTKHFGTVQLWPARNPELITRFEALLPLSPKGDRWSFSAPARCRSCRSEIAAPMTRDIYYVVFPDSVNLAGRNQELWLEFYVAQAS